MSFIDVVVARQAIFDRSQLVVGYELLFRSTTDTRDYAPRLDGDLMTSTVIFSTMNIGIEKLVGDRRIFCNADRGLITGAAPIVLPPARTVIEILETVAPDESVIAGCRQLVAAGYTLALDDFVWFDGVEPLLELASIVKLDLRVTPADELPELMRRCREYDVELLAEKIETYEEHQLCYDLGFEYFQGYALGRPRNVPGRTMPVSQLAKIKMSAGLLTGDPDIEELEDLVRTEPALMYQLLHLAAVGAQDGLRRDVRTVRDALLIVGSRRAQSWLALLLMRDVGSLSGDELEVALIRARMAELLAGSINTELGSLAFTAGMLSAFEFLLGHSPDELVKEFNLNPELSEAAFGDESLTARIVRDVVDYQSGRVSRWRRSGFGDVDFDIASIHATTWAVQVSRGLAAAA